MASKIEFVETPKAEKQPIASNDCGVWTTDSPAIKNAPLPAEGPGSRDFNNYMLIAILIGIPAVLTRLIGGGKFVFGFLFLIGGLPLLMAYWLFRSSMSPRLNEKVKYPGKPLTDYISFNDKELEEHWKGSKIPLHTFQELYIDGKVDFKGDALDVLEYKHDWATFRFTWGLFRYFLLGMIPEVIMHSRSQDEEQVRDHYDRGDDFYSFFLGPRMIYTSGIIGDINREETLEELQDNKLNVVCEKLELKEGETLLDLGCGWGTLARYASKVYGAKVTGITLGRNQTKWGNEHLKEDGIPEEQSRIVCCDYRDAPLPADGTKYSKISCLEMAEHVGVRKFGKFLAQVYDMLDDDGIFFLQYAGLRKYWQYEDLNWGLFMNQYIFPGADASTPLGWVIDKLEGAGFEVAAVDTIGVHYSATLWRWYRNWLANETKVKERYGARWFRIWKFFLATSTIVSRQGGATCFQIILRKNLNAKHRILSVPHQYGLQVPKPAKIDSWQG
ncbi:hypothetical protein CANCADRAFT_44906 [Tortispora caseinolytica NRRL Y-17796]|uniref:sphingolipid C(9)-methyltransferase n=1 Tax=Tortispora caseinolytica NRRL Y-17796 TaxID=767744 RepID=A0A1E4THT8_9ASCO|nr:hypothetical protein CANCADRAFT_44906 [Tortispora caseinolytica NRRL Y-17796]